MGRQETLTEISNILSVFKNKIQLLNKANELAINIQSENIMANILNSVYNYELVNANVVFGKNAAAIDLIDPDQGVAFQITANSSAEKVYNTLAKFLESNLRHKITQLFVFIITAKGNYRQDRINDILLEASKRNNEKSMLEFSVSRNIMDINDLYHIISNDTDIQRINKVRNKLQQELGELSDILAAIESKRTELFISFSDKDYKLIKPIILKLLTTRHTILHSSALLQEDPEMKEYVPDKLIQLTKESINSHHAKYCCLFLTGNFKEKWNRHTQCFILDNCIKKLAMIFSYQMDNEVADYVKLIGLPEKPMLYGKEEIQRIYEDILHKLKIYQPVDYRNFDHILQMSDPQSDIKLVAENSNYGFKIFLKTDPITDDRFWFICFYKYALQEGSYNYIELHHAEILSKRRFNILLIKEESQIELAKRKENFRQLFSPTKIWYVDEFVFEFCSTKELKNKEAESDKRNNFFVMPYLVTGNQEPVTLEDLQDWVNKADKPILVIKGSGGMGKTTLAYEMEDFFLSSKPNAKCIFIDSGSIVNILREKKVSDFYSLYELSYSQDEGKLSADRFRLNFDNGNLLIILDGIDEIIAKVSSFDINYFLDTVKEFTNALGKGKIIITCRDYFWNPSVEDLKVIFTVKIKPFTLDLAEEFFSKRHPSSASLVKKCIRAAKSVLGNNKADEEMEFIPYVLDAVDTQIDYARSKDDTSDGSEDLILFDSQILNPKSASDFILYNICNREQVKLEQENVDIQIELFIQLTLLSRTSKGAGVAEEEYKDAIDMAFPYLSEEVLKSFLGHPLLVIKSGIIYFKYDFFGEFFRNIYISQFITGNRDVTNFNESFVRSVATYGKYNSSFCLEISLRLGALTDIYLDNIIELIQKVKETCNIQAKELCRKAVCGLFMIALRLHYQHNIPDKDKNTALMLDIFGSQPVRDLYLIDIYETDKRTPIVFDFSNLQIDSAVIDNYDYFWRCSFNEHVLFTNSIINQLNDFDFGLTTAKREYFDKSCTISPEIVGLWREKGQEARSASHPSIKDLRQFLSLFKSHGHLRSRRIKNTEPAYAGRVIKLKNMISFCKEEGLIRQLTDSGEYDLYQIDNVYIRPISKYLSEGTISFELNSIIHRYVAWVNNDFSK